MPSFDWAEMSAREYNLRQSGYVEVKVKEVEDSEFPTLDSSQSSEGPANRTRSRKKPTPKKASTTNKFEKNLDLTTALRFTRSERVKKLEAERRKVEEGTSKHRKEGESQRKRRRSPSVSTVASLTPGRRPQPKKVQRIEYDNASQASTSSQRSQKS